MRKNLTLFCEGLSNRAGIERMTVELANLLVVDYNVSIVIINPFEKQLCPYEIDGRVDIFSLNSKFQKNLTSLNISLIRELRKRLKNIKTNVLITVATPLVRISAGAIIGLGIRNIAWEHFNLNAGSRIGKIYKLVAPWLVDKTIVLTKNDEANYKAGYAPRVECVPNFTSIGERNEPSDCLYKTVIAVGRHTHQKGFDLLIKAWAKALPNGWKLRIIGEGELKDDNIRLAKRLGVGNSIEFRPNTSKIADEYRQASCFILSSRYEGLVLVLIEAKMMGLPAICFDCPESPKEVVRDGEDGWLVERESVDALADELTKRLTSLEYLRPFGIRAREDALKRYSPASIKHSWIKIIEQK